MSNRPVQNVPMAVRQLGAAALRVRGPVAMTRFLRSEVLAGEGIPHGDQRPVVVLPPAIAGDWLMPVMLSWLRRIGYQAHRSSIALHIDCSDRTMSRVLPRVEEVAERHGRKVTMSVTAAAGCCPAPSRPPGRTWSSGPSRCAARCRTRSASRT